jgi:hypothetical protein
VRDDPATDVAPGASGDEVGVFPPLRAWDLHPGPDPPGQHTERAQPDQPEDQGGGAGSAGPEQERQQQQREPTQSGAEYGERVERGGLKREALFLDPVPALPQERRNQLAGFGRGDGSGLAGPGGERFEELPDCQV